MKSKNLSRASVAVACLLTLGVAGCGDDDAMDAGGFDAGPNDAAPNDASTDVSLDAFPDSGSLDISEFDAGPPPLLTELTITVDGTPLTLTPAFDPTINDYEAVIDEPLSVRSRYWPLPRTRRFGSGSTDKMGP